MRVSSRLRIGAVVAALAIVSSSSVLAGYACPTGTLGVFRSWRSIPPEVPGTANRTAIPASWRLAKSSDPRQTTRVKSLAALAKECTKATFFIVGERLALHPEIAKEVAEQAHTIGTHTWSHPNLARLSLPDVKREIEATFDAAQIASPAPVAPFFRYPCLSSSKLAADYLKSRNIGQFAMDIDSSDWRVRSSKSVIKKVMAVSKRGAAASS